MFDMHYDLLSILYYCYLKDDFSYIEELKINFNENNVNGLIANLYFMNREEMKKEIGNNEINVIEMFKVSVNLFKKYFPNIKSIFSIEGCDYIDIDDLEILRDLGLNSILLVWNNKNKYGSGVRSDVGLTTLGKKFIIKAIDLGLIIDLSHMNKNTFYDVVSLLKEEQRKGKKVNVIVSHSNCASLYDIPRNISDKQIELIKDLDPIVGLVSYSFFISEEKDIDKLKTNYIKHIKHVVDLLGIDNVGVSTDDMLFDKVLFNNKVDDVIFNYKTIRDDLNRLLSNYFTDYEIEKILYRNIERKIFS